MVVGLKSEIMFDMYFYFNFFMDKNYCQKDFVYGFFGIFFFVEEWLFGKVKNICVGYNLKCDN